MYLMLCILQSLHFFASPELKENKKCQRVEEVPSYLTETWLLCCDHTDGSYKSTRGDRERNEMRQGEAVLCRSTSVIIHTLSLSMFFEC